MILIKYTRYRNDFCQKEEVKTLENLQELEDWCFNSMCQPYGSNMYFPKSASRIALNIERGESIWITYIEQSAEVPVILFSTGKYTNGQKFISDKIMAFNRACMERMENPKFNFGEIAPVVEAQRNMDDLGRISIPKALRKAANIETGNRFLIKVQPDGSIILRKIEE